MTAALHGRLRLGVDRTRCDGHGLCHVLLADRIDLDEWGFPIVGDATVAKADERDVRRAVAACPALALHLNLHLNQHLNQHLNR